MNPLFESADDAPSFSLGDASVNWRGDLSQGSQGSFEKHPLHQQTYPWSLAVLKLCQKLITGAESVTNEDGEVEFRSWPSIEQLIDIRKNVMSVSAKLAGGLSSENRDADELKVSLEFLGTAYNHLCISLFLFRNLLLERMKTEDDEKVKWLFNGFLEEGTAIEGALRAHMERLRSRLWNE